MLCLRSAFLSRGISMSCTASAEFSAHVYRRAGDPAVHRGKTVFSEQRDMAGQASPLEKITKPTPMLSFLQGPIRQEWRNKRLKQLETSSARNPRSKDFRNDVPRGVIAEWTVTIVLLLFGTTTLVQAYVIPTDRWKTPS